MQGVKKFRFGEVEEENRIGVVTGLAYTQFGGDIFINRGGDNAWQRWKGFNHR